MHSISRELSSQHRPRLIELFANLSRQFDGAYNIVFLDARGDMVVARDPLGIRPLCYAIDGPLFAAASESVALANLGFPREGIRSLAPGHAIVIEKNQLTVEPFAASSGRAHCFFEWIYFANVASTFDGRSVYLSRKALGEELAQLETVPLDEETIVVPVPDTAKGAAAAMAYQLKVPCLEGLMRNRYVGRTFIEGADRAEKVRLKYTPLREVLEGKRVLLVEDTIVRSTTLQSLVEQVRNLGGAREIHVRVACPPIIAPCFYGIDMSTVDELIAPRYCVDGQITEESQQRLATWLGADSLRYLPVESVARAIGLPTDHLCRACITGKYPTPAGEKLYQIALENNGHGRSHGRTYDAEATVEQVG
jgi:amidophosphoribosyltransferase